MTEKAKKLSEVLYGLELFEKLTLSTRVHFIYRVPGGWVIENSAMNTATFIPFDNEFDIIK